MKKSLTILLLVTGLFAQGGITIVGGLNMGSIKYNHSVMADLIDISMKMGLSVGAEKMAGALKVGGAFVQRGTKTSTKISGEIRKGSDTYNYLTGYALYPYAIQERLSAFGGLQAGFFLSGSGEVEGGESF